MFYVLQLVFVLVLGYFSSGNTFYVFFSIIIVSNHSKCKLHSQFHCSIGLDSKTKSMYFMRTYTSFFGLHYKSESKIKSMIHPLRGKGRNPWWNSQNPINNHNEWLRLGKQWQVCPLNVVAKDLLLQSNPTRTIVFANWYTCMQNIRTKWVNYPMGKMLLDFTMLLVHNF
jgi:hypothetical protein